MLVLDNANLLPSEGEIQNAPDFHQITGDLSTYPCYIDNLPPEIVSEILLAVIDSHKNDIRQKWRLPLSLRRISRGFYHIITSTSSLWRYLYIRGPLHPYLDRHISHSEPVPLIAEVIYGGKNDDTGGDSGELGEAENSTSWRQIVHLMTSLFPRLRHLILYSSLKSWPVVKLLSHKMPILEVLDVEGMGYAWLEDVLLSTHFPSLRSLRLLGLFYCENCRRLPETVEELYIGGVRMGRQPQENLWPILPPKLRILWIGPNVVMEGLQLPHLARIHLPCVTTLRLPEYCTDTELSALQCLDAPCLQTLEVCLDYHTTPGLDFRTWYLDFPALTHLKWRSHSQVPHFANFLRRCGSLTSLHIETRPSNLISDFVVVLTTDSTLLPLVDDFMVFGVSLSRLKNLVKSRPRLKRLEIHEMDLGPRGLDVVARSPEWYECRAWLASRVELCANGLRGFSTL